MPAARVHLYVSGRVQRVNYRRDTRRRALALGLTGWVRNLPDGRVEEFIRWCREGPAFAIVREVEVRREPPTGEFETFTVRR